MSFAAAKPLEVFPREILSSHCKIFGRVAQYLRQLEPGTESQWTNILRDVPEDFAMGRVYLPQEDLARFGCSESDLASPVASPTFVEVMRFEAKRAWRFYEEGARLLKLVRGDSQASLWTLIRIYS